MRIRVLALFCLFLVPACGPKNPSTGPETTTGGKVAYQAGRVLEGVHEIQQLVAGVAAQPNSGLPTDLAGKVMIAAYKAGDAGEKLEPIARSYDAAVAAGAANDQARLASEINKLLLDIDGAFKGNAWKLDATAPKIAQLVVNVLASVNAVRALIPQLKDLVQPATEAALAAPEPLPLALWASATR